MIILHFRNTKQSLFFHDFHIPHILGDPGAVSGDGEKSKTGEKKFGRRKVKNAFLRPNFFSPVLDFSPSPLTAPGSPRMYPSVHDIKIESPGRETDKEF